MIRLQFVRNGLIPCRSRVGPFQTLSRAGFSRLATPTPGLRLPSSRFLAKSSAFATAGLGISIWSRPQIHCDDDVKPNVNPGQAPPGPPESIISVYQLSFGTITGICAGVFVKKGAKLVAFFLGGVFVLLQYLRSLSIVRVDWTRAGAQFERLVPTTAAGEGGGRVLNVKAVWNWFVDFLTADFQPRASFIAGLMLGFRIG